MRSSAGSDNGSAGVEVRAAPPPVQLPDVSISCPSSAAVDQSVACTASNSGGAIDTYAWSDSGGGSGSGSSYSTSFNTSGAKTVSLTASNRAGSDSDSTTVGGAGAAVAACDRQHQLFVVATRCGRDHHLHGERQRRRD